eukprot:TRINITY_DN2964_c0_g1_i3.p1 TRINITY_DN2964_c0_g1~~TRINITY_DN2964_c0_g1_i3.p1  ORF type:complete len:138 (+),score=53.24 TRINITY_DN2964_c0_g1_i3:300-713(+)
MAWAMEVKKSNLDILGQMQMKDLFKEYVEDFNTATMPSEKYYDLQSWDQKMAAKRQKKKRGDEMTDAQRASLASFDDESARKEEHKAHMAKKQEQALQEQLQRLRGDKAKVQAMRQQELDSSHKSLLEKHGHGEKRA